MLDVLRDMLFNLTMVTSYSVLDQIAGYCDILRIIVIYYGLLYVKRATKRSQNILCKKNDQVFLGSKMIDDLPCPGTVVQKQ